MKGLPRKSTRIIGRNPRCSEGRQNSRRATITAKDELRRAPHSRARTAAPHRGSATLFRWGQSDGFVTLQQESGPRILTSGPPWGWRRPAQREPARARHRPADGLFADVTLNVVCRPRLDTTCCCRALRCGVILRTVPLHSANGIAASTSRRVWSEQLRRVGRKGHPAGHHPMSPRAMTLGGVARGSSTCPRR